MKRNNGKANGVKAGKGSKAAKVAKGPTKAQAKVTSNAKPAKAPKAAKVTKAESAPRVDTRGTVLTGGMKWGSGMVIDDSMVITAVADNTKRGASRERFAKYKVGRTVAQVLAIEGGPHRGDIRWDAGKGLITLAKAKAGKAKGKAA